MDTQDTGLPLAHTSRSKVPMWENITFYILNFEIFAMSLFSFHNINTCLKEEKVNNNLSNSSVL